MGTGGTRGWGGSHGGKRTHVAVGGTWSWQRPLGMRRHVGWTEPRRTEGTQVTGGDTEVARPPWGQGHVAGGDTRGANARAPPAPQPITASPPRDVTHRRGKNTGEGAWPRAVTMATTPAMTTPPRGDTGADRAPSRRYRSGSRPLRLSAPSPGLFRAPAPPAPLRDPPVPPLHAAVLPPPARCPAAAPPRDVITQRPPLQDGGGRAGLSWAQARTGSAPGTGPAVPGRAQPGPGRYRSR